MSFDTTETDVIICGAGPAGLLVAYGLQRFGVRTCLIEKYIKAELPMYGRACTLYPRSLELLDSYELLHEMAQAGVVSRGSVTYKQGTRVPSRGWNSIFTKMGDTFLNYVLNLRLKYSEDIFAAAYKKLGGVVHEGWEVVDMDVNTSAADGYKVSVQAKRRSTGEMHSVKSKYVVGADGAHSIVRTLANIDMPSTGSEYHWVRIDGVIETDLPDAALGSGSVESPTHGNVLFVRLDHGRSRIGFSLNKMLYEKYGAKISQKDAMYEAQQAMLPFKCEFKGEPDWHTCYTIRQALAETLIKDDCVIIVGDAAHIHSSSAAQGMNTGIHDATNLSWKLAGVIQNIVSPLVLETYNTERHASAAHLISLDKKFSALISGDIPADMVTNHHTSADELLGALLEQSMQFNIGLGISYPDNILNQQPTSSMLIPGTRAPDRLLYEPGSRVPVRLQTITANKAVQFNVLVFVGEPAVSRESILTFRKYLDDSPTSIIKTHPASAFRFLTIVTGNKPMGEEALGCRRFGDTWYDWDSSCHYGFGVAPENGGVCVTRPDGVFGFAVGLHEGEKLSEYFGSFMKKVVAENGVH